jgi:hypothetical protein
VDARLIEKRQQLTAGERGFHWALSKRKKGYSKIDEALRLLLVEAFNNHPHAVMAPNLKDTLQHKNKDGKIVLVRKVLTQVGLGSIFSDIVHKHPTIKNRVGERASVILLADWDASVASRIRTNRCADAQSVLACRICIVRCRQSVG